MTETCAVCKETFYATAPHQCPKKDKKDGGKPTWSLIPWDGMKSVLDVFAYGARKYSAHGWKTVPNAQQRYREATFRHALAALEGEAIDPESGLPHLAHCVASALISLAFQLGAVAEMDDKSGERSTTNEAGSK